MRPVEAQGMCLLGGKHQPAAVLVIPQREQRAQQAPADAPALRGVKGATGRASEGGERLQRAQGWFELPAAGRRQSTGATGENKGHADRSTQAAHARRPPEAAQTESQET